jgi:acid stress-induced BolA-like protein IbaG/YrbA
MDSQTIKDLIERGLPDSAAQVFSEDNTHFRAVVVAEAFAGKRALARHQQVYATLGSLVGADIHALSIRAYTPEEWRAVEGTGGEPG